VRRHAHRLGDEGIAWLDSLPSVVDWCAWRWALHIGATLASSYSLVVEAERSDSTASILKVSFPEPEQAGEAEGLRRWDGHGAVRLLEADAERSALLIERCVPGRALREVPEDEALRVVLALLPRLWLPAEPAGAFDSATQIAARWATELPELHARAGARCEPALVDRAIAAFRELGPSQRHLALVHRDFHGGNVLSATREPWLVIDPKPTVAEREFDAAWYLGDRSDTLTTVIAVRRLDAFASELGLERERMRLWTVARYVLGGLWSYDGGGNGRWGIEVARVYAGIR